MPIKKQRHCRARTKKKIRLLREKSFMNRVIEHRAEKIAKLKRKQNNPGATVRGEAKKYARRVTFGDGGLFGSLLDHKHFMNLNQRQKRKRLRQRNGHK